MPETLLDDFEMFFIELPAEVRHDLCFMMAILPDENFVFDDGADIYEHAAQRLFQAKTRIGRIGNLIQAAAIFDIYFAMDAAGRFDTDRRPARRTTDSHYVGRVDAIAAARQRWNELRATKFAPAAIAAALIPPGMPNKRTRRSATANANDMQRVSQ